MKLRTLLVIASCLVSLLTGWIIAQSKSAAPEKGRAAPILIGFSMDTLKEERFQQDRDDFVQRARELGAEVLVQSANSDDARQITDVETLISRKVKVMVIMPHNGAAMAKAVRMAHEAGIPVLAYDRLITDCDLDLYISFDNRKVGRLQAQFLADRLPAEGKLRLVRLYGSKSDHNALLFKEGQDEVLRPLIESGRIEVIHEDWVQDWKPENAKKIVNAAITRHGTAFDAILASNDGTAGGAIQALTEEGLAGKILVTGQDAELTACQRIVNGVQAMTVYKPIARCARAAAELAVKLATGKPVIAGASLDNNKIQVPSVLEDIVAVTRQNMMDTVIKDGFHSYDEVYKGVAENERPKGGK
jgi:D-xylose transport system substrate-binding protein